MTNAETKATEFVDIAPTWEAAAQIFIMCLEAGTHEGQRNAKIEITNMAKALDAANRKLLSIQAALEE